MEDVERHLHECLAPWPFFLPSCCVLTTPIAGCQARLRHLSLHSPFRHGSPLNGGHQREGKKEEEMQLWHRNAPPKEGGA